MGGAKTWGAATLVMGGALLGVVLLGGADVAMEQTSRTAFCISCHELRATVYEEWKASPHYANAAGVRADCADCHVPRHWAEKVRRKARGALEVYHHLAGTIATPELFEAKRAELAERVWAEMKANDSANCRTCHSFAAMDFARQSDAARGAMGHAEAAGQTCVDCHRGVAHKMPDLAGRNRVAQAEILSDAAATRPAPGETVYAATTAPFTLARPADGDFAAFDGKIVAATPLEVLERDGDLMRVRLAGWREEAAPRVLYAAPGLRILSAALTPEAVGAIGGAAAPSGTPAGWTPATLDVWTPAADATADRAALMALGAQMYAASCDGCHAVPLDRHDANAWIGAFDRMRPYVKLDDADYRFLLKYVQLNAPEPAR